MTAEKREFRDELCDVGLRTLYHLIWGHPSLDLLVPFEPRIPKNIMESENNTVKRICTAPTVEDCALQVLVHLILVLIVCWKRRIKEKTP